MSKIFKRNQLIITALAALVAVAGYLSFGDTKKDAVDTAGETETTTALVEPKDTKDLSDADVLAGIKAGEGDINSTDADVEGTPGEAILVNATGTADYITTAKLDKEYLRAKLMEDLLEIVNNTEITGEEKKVAVDKYTALSSVAEKELLAENEIKARGYENACVTMIDNKVEVIVLSTPLKITEITRIEEAVKSSLQVEAKDITITVVDTTK